MAIQTPFVAVDGIIQLFDTYNNFQGIIFIERKNPPFGIALPGGFVDIGESCEDALIREMQEEVTLNVEIESLLGVYSDPARDDRFHTVSAVYICKATGTPKAADDAKAIYIYNIEDIPLHTLVFDHAQILKDFINTL